MQVFVDVARRQRLSMCPTLGSATAAGAVALADGAAAAGMDVWTGAPLCYNQVKGFFALLTERKIRRGIWRRRVQGRHHRLYRPPQ
jgi:hypothetical protein